MDSLAKGNEKEIHSSSRVLQLILIIFSHLSNIFVLIRYHLRMYINKYSQQFDYMLICLQRVLLLSGRPMFVGDAAAPLVFFWDFFSYVLVLFLIEKQKFSWFFLFLKHMKLNLKQLRILNFHVCSFLQCRRLRELCDAEASAENATSGIVE